MPERGRKQVSTVCVEISATSVVETSTEFSNGYGSVLTMSYTLDMFLLYSSYSEINTHYDPQSMLNTQN